MPGWSCRCPNFPLGLFTIAFLWPPEQGNHETAPVPRQQAWASKPKVIISPLRLWCSQRGFGSLLACDPRAALLHGVEWLLSPVSAPRLDANQGGFEPWQGTFLSRTLLHWMSRPCGLAPVSDTVSKCRCWGRCCGLGPAGIWPGPGQGWLVRTPRCGFRRWASTRLK